MFGWFFKRKNAGKEETPMTKDERMIAEAEENGATDEAKLDESVGEQEHLDHDKDTQDAKDRVDESLGEKKAEEAKEEEAGEETPVEHPDEIPPALKEYVDTAIAMAVEGAVDRAVAKALAEMKTAESRESHPVTDPEQAKRLRAAAVWS